MTTHDMAKAIIEAADDSLTPDDLRQRLVAFATEHRDKIAFLRTHLLYNAVEFIQHMEGRGVRDREVLDRIAAQELAYASALMVMALYRRLGRPASAGRFALVAYDLFESAAALPEATPETMARIEAETADHIETRPPA